MIASAIEATVATLATLFALLWFINQFRKKKFCVVCGEPSYDDFCCEAHELLHYDEEEFSRDEIMERDLDEALAEQRELEREDDKRWEKQTKCLP